MFSMFHRNQLKKDALSEAQKIVSRICQANGISPEPSIRITVPSKEPIPNAFIMFSRKRPNQATIYIDQRLYNGTCNNALEKTIAHEIAHYYHRDPSYIGIWDDLCAKFGGQKATIKRNTNIIIKILREIRADIDGAQYSSLARTDIIDEFNKLHKECGNDADTLQAHFCNHYPPYVMRAQFVREYTSFTIETIKAILKLYADANYNFNESFIFQVFDSYKS